MAKSKILVIEDDPDGEACAAEGPAEEGAEAAGQEDPINRETRFLRENGFLSP